MDDKQYPQQEALNEVKKKYMNIFSISEGRNDFVLLDKSFPVKQAIPPPYLLLSEQIRS